MNFTGINELNQSKLIISPNPAKDNFSIMGLDKLGNVNSMVLKDLNGKIVKVLNPKATQFKITDLKSGVYFLTITAKNKQEVIKLIKE
jgi:bifunctional DNase/RNase